MSTLQACFPNASEKILKSIRDCVAEYAYAVTVMCCVLCSMLDRKTLSRSQVDMVRHVLQTNFETRMVKHARKAAAKSGKRSKSMAGGNGIPFTGIGALGYDASNGAGTDTSTVQFDAGLARSALEMSGGAHGRGGRSGRCADEVRALITKSVRDTLATSSLRRKSDAVDEMVRLIYANVSDFIARLSSCSSLDARAVKKYNKLYLEL